MRASPRRDVAAVLNVGTAHIGEFGSREAIAQAKGEIVEALREPTAPPCSTPTTTLVRRDGRAHRAQRRRPSAPAAADVAVGEITTDELGRQSFELQCTADRGATVHLAQVGATSGATPRRPPRWRSPPGSTSTPSPTR